MIDLHCHILPALDDGAHDVADSVAMARQAEDDGIAVICATPHIRPDHTVAVEQIAARTDALRQELSVRGISVHVLPGGELAEAEADRLSDAQLRRVTLGEGGRWLLLEPAPGPLGDELEAVVIRLASRGFASVVAHPERHVGARFESRLRRLAALGCLIQWTAEFCAAARPEDLVLTLAADGLVHLLGSDAHSAGAGRPVRLSAGYASLAAACTPERIRWMKELAPQAIVRGDPVSEQP